MVEVLAGKLLAVLGEDARPEAYHGHVLGRLEGMNRQAGGQVAAVSGRQVDRPEGEDQGIALQGHRRDGFSLEWRLRMAMRIDLSRSEERRVGKECRSRWSPYH